ncbi:glycosyltransferase [Pedobacter sp. MC2016-14]|uniref:glycosyltransferase family 2 protein n=1 Tax=Pedobacter sp. MC2016-14 TaxID=2897327 RepID=UPI001E310AC9|nr:glycosyltransferase [Pedobacter sp. MC2016-14]MCD0486843.1 glycosyltransferase [Pedobacter sp. MC2016-14]
MNCPEISVIIPSHNNGTELERAIQSILQQDALINKSCRLSIVLVNDASESSFLPALEALKLKYPELQLLHTPKQSGPAAARNLGLKSAKGQFISFLDADDEWPLNRISLLLPYFQDPNLSLVGGKVKYIVAEGAIAPEIRYEDQAEQRITHVHLGALLLRKSIFDTGFYFDEKLTYSEDVDWWLRLRESHTGILITEYTTLLYHVHGNNMSVHKSIQDLQMLKVLHQSLQRRRKAGKDEALPQIKDFRSIQPDPLISIIIPLYNGKLLLQQALKSVLQQSYQHWELIIVDDGSTDGGADWLTENYPQAILIRQKNKGVAAARNTGIKAANGALIAFLDQDDEWTPDKLEKQWLLLKQNPYCSFVTCNQLFKCADNTTLPAFFKTALLQAHRSFVPSAILIRKHALLSLGGFDENMENSNDMDLVRRLRNSGFAELNAGETLLYKWYHANNASYQKDKIIKEMLILLQKQIKGQ